MLSVSKNTITAKGDPMSKKRMMSKQQRLYYEYSNREKIRQELIEYIKQQREIEQLKKYRINNAI